MANCTECGSKLKNGSNITLSLHWGECLVMLKKVQEFKEALKNEDETPAKEEVVEKIQKSGSYIHSHLSVFLYDE